MVRSNVSIRGLSIFDNEIKLTACADDTTIFIKDLNSFYHLIRVFDQFQKLLFFKAKYGQIKIRWHRSAERGPSGVLWM